MPSPPSPFSPAVWSSSPLHVDALVAVLREAGERAGAVLEPEHASRILVAAVDATGLVSVVRRRARAARETIVWGGTLPPQRICALRDAGASAYVSALALPGEVVEVVHRVREGEDVSWPSEPGPAVELTRREREVARAYLATQPGRTRAEVASGLGISERTLKVHIARIRDKAGHDGTATREGLHHELSMRGWV